MRVTSFLGLIGLIAVASILAGCGPSGPTPTPAVPVDGVLEVDMRNYVYEPRSFEFKVGETVEFRLISEDEPHTFTVKELGINWVVPKNEEPQVETFTFNEAGTYRLVCAVAGHEGSGMVGKITVVE